MAFRDHFGYYGPTRLVMGRGTVGEIPQIVREARVQKAQIVTDAGLVAAGVVARGTVGNISAWPIFGDGSQGATGLCIRR